VIDPQIGQIRRIEEEEISRKDAKNAKLKSLAFFASLREIFALTYRNVMDEGDHLVLRLFA
jgi:hypothetical protein